MVIRGAGVLCVLTSPLWASALLFSGNYALGAALFFIPAILFLNLMLVFHATRTDPFLRTLLPIAMIWKVAAAACYLFLVYNVLEGGDVLAYFDSGRILMDTFQARGEGFLLSPVTGTNFITMATALLMFVTGASLPTLVIAFSMFSFWGQYFLYRAFTTAFPEGQSQMVAVLLFFLPSIAFWTATIGKEALILFFIGLATYGFARMLRKVGPAAYLMAIVGTLGTMMVRPHIAGMLGVSAAVPYLTGRNRQGVVGVLGRMIGIPLVLAGTYFLAIQASEFVNARDFNQGVTTINQWNENSNAGGSATGGGSLAARVVMAPFILFRPFPWEVHNPVSLLAALEGLLFLYLFWRYRRSIMTTLRGWQSNIFAAFVGIFAAEFAVAFAGAIGNLGVLTRQRVMLLPFAVMLLYAEPEAARRRARVPASRPLSGERPGIAHPGPAMMRPRS